MASRFGSLFPRALIVVLLSVLLVPAGASAQRSLYVFNTQLTGAAERPHQGDPDGKGKAQIKINVATGEICYSLRVKDIDTIVGAHIHEITMPNGNGPIRLHLEEPKTGRSEDCVTDVPLANAIVANPGAYYVNVHTTDIPAGAIRGDLR